MAIGDKIDVRIQADTWSTKFDTAFHNDASVRAGSGNEVAVSKGGKIYALRDWSPSSPPISREIYVSSDWGKTFTLFKTVTSFTSKYEDVAMSCTDTHLVITGASGLSDSSSDPSGIFIKAIDLNTKSETSLRIYDNIPGLGYSYGISTKSSNVNEGAIHVGWRGTLYNGQKEIVAYLQIQVSPTGAITVRSPFEIVYTDDLSITIEVSEDSTGVPLIASAVKNYKIPDPSAPTQAYLADYNVPILLKKVPSGSGGLPQICFYNSAWSMSRPIISSTVNDKIPSHVSVLTVPRTFFNSDISSRASGDIIILNYNSRPTSDNGRTKLINYYMSINGGVKWTLVASVTAQSTDTLSRGTATFSMDGNAHFLWGVQSSTNSITSRMLEKASLAKLMDIVGGTVTTPIALKGSGSIANKLPTVDSDASLSRMFVMKPSIGTDVKVPLTIWSTRSFVSSTLLSGIYAKVDMVSARVTGGGDIGSITSYGKILDWEVDNYLNYPITVTTSQTYNNATKVLEELVVPGYSSLKGVINCSKESWDSIPFGKYGAPLNTGTTPSTIKNYTSLKFANVTSIFTFTKALGGDAKVPELIASSKDLTDVHPKGIIKTIETVLANAGITIPTSNSFESLIDNISKMQKVTKFASGIIPEGSPSVVSGLSFVPTTFLVISENGYWGFESAEFKDFYSTTEPYKYVTNSTPTNQSTKSVLGSNSITFTTYYNTSYARKWIAFG